MESFFDEPDKLADLNIEDAEIDNVLPRINSILAGQLEIKTQSGQWVPWEFILSGPWMSLVDTETGEIRKTVNITWKRLIPFMDLQLNGPRRYGFKIEGWDWREEFYLQNEDELDSWLDSLIPQMIMKNIEQDYDLGTVLGYGNFAKVYSGKSREDGRWYAIKSIKKEKLEDQRVKLDLLREIETMRMIKHNSVAQLHRVYEDDNVIHLVMDYAWGDTLYRKICRVDKYKEKSACALLRNLLEAVAFIHENGIIHRDIKLENILLKQQIDKEQILLADFGLAAIGTEFTFKCGSPGYIAPEIFNEDPYTHIADWFSIGIVMFILLSGRMPFEGTAQKDILKHNKKGILQYKEKYWGVITQEGNDLVRRLCEPDPAKRISASEALDHPWFKLQHPEQSTSSGFLMMPEKAEIPVQTPVASPTEQTHQGFSNRALELDMLVASTSSVSDADIGKFNFPQNPSATTQNPNRP